MNGCLTAGDNVTFACVDGTDSTRLHGTVRERASNYVRVRIHTPQDHPNVTLETDDDYGARITVCRDYSMEILGHAHYVKVVNKGYKTVIHCK